MNGAGTGGIAPTIHHHPQSILWVPRRADIVYCVAVHGVLLPDLAGLHPGEAMIPATPSITQAFVL